MSLKYKFARWSKGFRHGIVGRLAPRIYSVGVNPYFPRPTILAVRRLMRDEPVVGCEIGVDEGVHALNILGLLNISKLYLVDPYLPYVEKAHGRSEVQDHFYARENARRTLAPFDGKTVFIYETSEKAADRLPHGLDFVYVDGNHSYEYVKKDVEFYYFLVRPGGVLGGHDYARGFDGVIKAVDEFEKKMALDVHHEQNDWWLQKPELPFTARPGPSSQRGSMPRKRSECLERPCDASPLP